MSIFRWFGKRLSFAVRRAKLKRRNVRIHITAYVDSYTVFEGGNVISPRVTLYESRVGYGSYLAVNASFKATLIGRYSSVGPNVGIICGQHPSREIVSTHPAFFSLEKQSGFTYVTKQLFDEYRYADKEKRFHVIIGHDVWIGAGAKIMEGVCVNNGAIISAGALVINDVPPYAIVGGVPAKVIRYRFDKEDIEFLLGLQWWNKGEDWIRVHACDFRNVKKLKLSLKMNDMCD